MKRIIYLLGISLLLITACGSGPNPTNALILTDGRISDTITLEDIKLLKTIASLRNELILVGQIRLEGVTLADQKKTTGIISELLDRAEQKILGELPSGRFPWSWAGFDEPPGMVDMAEGFLEVLASRIDPLEGKFAEPGGMVIDHAIIKKDNLWHLIYIRGMAGTNWPDYPTSNFGHAVSHDLVNWHIEEPVLETVNEEFDSYQVWAPHIIEHAGKYWNFYTGVNDSVSQTICLATSDDLYHWERYKENPLFNSLPWGFWDESHWSDCRDPMVLKDGQMFYCYYTAGRMIPDTEQFEYCLGIASSKDLLSWKDEGFRRLEHTLGTPPESPFVVKKNGEFYLFYTNYKHGIVYVRSNNPLDGWQENPDDPQSIIEGVSASEIFEENGKWYITYISHMANALHFLEIKEVIWNEDGTVSVEDADL
ncbi:MAG: family 43 glycosylhydrolase [Anaerolineales bacterium]|nr:family 43 glycosylhydrolase [Anaerolineales bacterium]